MEKSIEIMVVKAQGLRVTEVQLVPVHFQGYARG